MIKADPSPLGDGFAFNLFGDPYGNLNHALALLDKLTVKIPFARAL